MILPIVNVSTEVTEKIKKMLDDEGVRSRNLRIAARIDYDDDKLCEGFQLFQSELTLNDQYQEFDGFNIIIAKILLQLHGGFTLSCTTLTCTKENYKTKVKITPDRTAQSGIYRGPALGTAANH
jgi:hypothetical protein